MTTAKDAPTDQREAAIEHVSDAAAAATASQAVLIEQALKLPQELTRFCAHRMSRDLETMQALSRCRTPADVVNVWTEAAHTAAEDYREEMTRVMDLVSSNGASKASANGVSRGKKK